MKWIIIDLKKDPAWYRVNGIAMRFSSKEAAREVALRFFGNEYDFLLIQVRL